MFYDVIISHILQAIYPDHYDVIKQRSLTEDDKNIHKLYLDLDFKNGNTNIKIHQYHTMIMLNIVLQENLKIVFDVSKTIKSRDMAAVNRHM